MSQNIEKQECTKDKTETNKGTIEEDGYYRSRPKFGKNGPSKLRQQFRQGMAFCVAVSICILLFFALLRLEKIAKVIQLTLGILKPIIYGLGIAYLLNPVVKMVDQYLIPILKKRFPNMKKEKEISRAIGILLAIVLLLSIIITLCNMMLPELYRSIRNMIITVPSQMNSAMKGITKLVSGDSAFGRGATYVLNETVDYIQNWMKTDLLDRVNVVMSNLTVGVINVVSELFNAVIGLIISIYILWGKETFSRQSKKLVYALFNPNHSNMILHLTIKSNEMFGGFLIGKIIDSLIIGILCFIGLSILNMPYTMLVSVIVGVTNVIPFFGPYIGAIPSSILITLSDPIKGLYFLIFILILQQVDGNIIGPKILGESTGLSAFWVVFSILLGGGLFGVVGMILGVPTFAVIYYTVSMVIDHKLEKKQLPTETEAYDELSYVNSRGVYVHSKDNQDKNEGE